MNKKFVKICFEVRCEWEGFAPQYRIFVNDELFTERSFIWNKNTYIKEMLQIEAEPGNYEIRFEELDPKSGEFNISKPYVMLGDAVVHNNTNFEIRP